MLLALALPGVLSCTKIEFEDGAGTGTFGSVLALTVQSSWNGNEDVKTTHATCTIPLDSPEGSYTCTAAIPEGQLYLSKLYFTIEGYEPCEILKWYPYRYQMSASPAFTPAWSDTPINCSNPIWTLNPAGCFNGPAKSMITEFPKYVYELYLVSQNNKKTYELEPAFTTLFDRGTNRYSCNTLSNRSVNLTGTGDGYVANSFQDYVLSCQDKWEQPLYEIRLILSDDDESSGNPNPDSGTSNHRADWNSAFDPS